MEDEIIVDGPYGKYREERLGVHDFALVKEYLRVGGNYNGISDVTGLAPLQVREVDETKYYKDYMKKQDKRFIEYILNEEGNGET